MFWHLEIVDFNDLRITDSDIRLLLQWLSKFWSSEFLLESSSTCWWALLSSCSSSFILEMSELHILYKELVLLIVAARGVWNFEGWVLFLQFSHLCVYLTKLLGDTIGNPLQFARQIACTHLQPDARCSAPARRRTAFPWVLRSPWTSYPGQFTLIACRASRWWGWLTPAWYVPLAARSPSGATE